MSFEPTVTVSIRMKVDLGNYQNADVFVSLNQVPFGYTETDIDGVITDTAEPMAARILREVRARCREIRGDGEARPKGQATFEASTTVTGGPNEPD